MASLAEFVRKNDLSFFYLVNRRLHCSAMDLLMTGMTFLGSSGFAVAISAAFILMDRKIGLMLSVDLILVQIVIQLLKRAVNRPRPYAVYNWVIAQRPPKCKYSFPSGHTSTAFSIALTLSLFFPGIGVLTVMMASATGVSRIYLGVHYPTDVSAGFLIALLAFEIVKTLPLLH